jgi:hypothetical protein
MRCAVCHHLFAGETSFEVHRRGEMPAYGKVGEANKARYCLTPAQMREIGLKRDRHGRWCRLAPKVAANDEEEETRIAA